MARFSFLALSGALLLLLVVSGTNGQAINHAQQVENIANLAEKMSDRQHDKYCERFGEKINAKSDIWPMIMKQCIDKLVFDRANADLPANFPAVNEEIGKKIQEIHSKCANLVSNPCVGDDWKNVKQCIREEGVRIDVLNAGQTGGAAPKNMPSISLGIATFIFDCTAKQLDGRR